MKTLLIIITASVLSVLTSSCTTATKIDPDTKTKTSVTRFMGIPLTSKSVTTKPKYN